MTDDPRKVATSTKTPFRKVGIEKPTPTNLEKVVEQLRQVVLELQGAVGPPGLRAVRVEELARIGIVRVSPDGLTLGAAITGAVDVPPVPPSDYTYDTLGATYDDPAITYDGA